MKLAATPTIEPGEFVFRIARVETASDGRGQPCLRWTYATPDGAPYTEFTPKRFGPRSNARAILQAAAGTTLPDEVETDAFIGRELKVQIIQHPNGDWRRRIAAVAAPDGTMERPLRGANGRPWNEIVAEVAV